MRCYLDCEFNSHGGELISLALVAEDGREFYAVVSVPVDPHPWVAANVLPLLGAEPVGREAALEGLRAFLEPYERPSIVADWPADFVHLFNLMCGADYGRAFCPLVVAILAQPPREPAPDVPHNALSDARALRDAFQS